jgi:hypothetical protein
MLMSKPKIFFLIIVGQFLSMASTCWAQQAAGTTTPSERPNGMITGRVVNSAGEPLSGAAVYASLLGSTTRAQRGTVDIGGEFKIEGLRGLYRAPGERSRVCSESQLSPTDAQSYYHVGDW